MDNMIFILYVYVISLGLNLIFFCIAYIFKTDVFTDITYSLTFLLINTIMIAWHQQVSGFQILIYVLTSLWALRLGSYLFIRILKTKKDSRFDNIRNNFWKFLSFWFLQAGTVFIIVLPSSFALSINSSYFQDLWYTYVIAIIGFGGLILEGIADIQKNYYYNHRDQFKSKFAYIGLWKISRHPNYFGEITFWLLICISIICSVLVNGYNNDNLMYLNLLWLLSPLYLMLLLNFVSGLPMLEVRSWERLSSDIEYQNYIKKTSIIIPWIGKKGHIFKVRKKLKNKN